MACTVDPEENTVRAIDGIREAAADGADIVCLPELFRTRYFCQTEDASLFAHAETVPGPTTDLLAEEARKLGVDIVASLFERRASGIYHNTSALVRADSGFVGKYRKMHIPDDPRYYEKFYFTPGDLGFVTFESRRARIGALICWDQWYPEAARAASLRGAEILFYPTAIGWHPDERDNLGEQQHEAWELMQRSHAVANGVFVVSVNRVGFEPAPDAKTVSEGIQFWGQSFVAGPDGSIWHRSPSDRDDVAVVELDLSRIDFMRHGWPFLRDRRIEAYGDLSERYVDHG